MTLKEAVLKSLEDINDITNYLAVYNHIVDRKYYDFGLAKTPAATISSALGDFIRNGDTRVKRIKQDGGTYTYYLTKNEQNIGIDILSGDTKTQMVKPVKINKLSTYDERDLHKLLSSYRLCCTNRFGGSLKKRMSQKRVTLGLPHLKNHPPQTHSCQR